MGHPHHAIHSHVENPLQLRDLSGGSFGAGFSALAQGVHQEVCFRSGQQILGVGSAQLPWTIEICHEFRMEMALRQYDPTVALPYWDSTLDAALDDPTGRAAVLCPVTNIRFCPFYFFYLFVTWVRYDTLHTHVEQN